jgi:hypothetical protein
MAEPDIHLIRQAVLGATEPTVPRAEAMAHLLAAKPPDAHATFETVLVNHSEDVRFRALAAAYLGRLKTPQAYAALLGSLERLEQSTVLSAALRVAGHIADASTLPALDKLAQHQSGAVARLARFAAVLTTHRLNLPGHEVALPSDSKLSAPGAGTPSLPVRIAPANPNETAKAHAVLTKEPLGIALSPRLAWRMQCANFVWMLFPNAEFVGPQAMAWLTSRKSVAIVLASQQRESGALIPSMYLLAEPAGDKHTVAALVFAADGRLCYAGRGSVAGSRVTFTIRTVVESGSLAASVEGAFDGATLTITVATSAAAPPSPRPEPPPLPKSALP